MFVHNRPLRDVMSATARLLGGRWIDTSTPHGYYFYIRKSEVQVENRWWQLFLAQRRNDRSDNNRRAMSALAAPQVFTYTNNTVSGDTGGGAQGDALMKAEQFVSAHTQDFVYQLPTPIRRRLTVCHYGLDQYLCTDDFGISTYFVSPGDMVVSTGDLPRFYKRFIFASLLQFGVKTAPGSGPMLVQLANKGGNISALYVRPDGIKYALLPGFPITSAILTPVDQSYLPAYIQTRRKLRKNVSNDLLQLSAYASSTTWPLPSTVVGTHPSAKQTDGPVALPPSRADLLDRIALNGGQDIIADYTWQRAQPLSALQLRAPLEGTVDTALNRCSIQTDSSWYRCKSGIVIDRDNRWYRDNRLSVSHRHLEQLLKSLNSVLELHGSSAIAAELSLDANVWKRLSPWQLMNGFKWAQLVPPGAKSAALVFAPLLAQIRQSWPTVEFCACLSSQQIRQLANGGQRLSSLRADQLSVLRRLLPAVRYYAPDQFGNLKVSIVQDPNVIISSNCPLTSAVYGRMLPRLLLHLAAAAN